MTVKGPLLTTNGFLGNGDFLLSDDGRFAAVLQDDGNLTLCHASHGVPDLAHPYWSSLAGGHHGVVVPHARYFAIMQGDGNLVLYNGASPASQGAPYWASNTLRPGTHPYVLLMQDDGNLVVYVGTPAARQAALWASNTVNPPPPARVPVPAAPTPPPTTPPPSVTATTPPPASVESYTDETYGYAQNATGTWTTPPPGSAPTTGG